MDPATIFSVAVNALQLVDYGVKVAKTLHEIYKRGSTIHNESLRAEAQSLIRVR